MKLQKLKTIRDEIHLTGVGRDFLFFRAPAIKALYLNGTEVHIIFDTNREVLQLPKHSLAAVVFSELANMHSGLSGTNQEKFFDHDEPQETANEDKVS